VTADLRTTLWVVHSNGSGLRQIHPPMMPALTMALA
jgi:hypothetical protein